MFSFGISKDLSIYVYLIVGYRLKPNILLFYAQMLSYDPGRHYEHMVYLLSYNHIRIASTEVFYGALP